MDSLDVIFGRAATHLRGFRMSLLFRRLRDARNAGWVATATHPASGGCDVPQPCSAEEGQDTL
ncbi:hypothetical protein J2X46_001833 [Nocardioides sp. BE266]|nr:hypothetical protein [Nocardioides sp. BE266]